MKKKKIRIGGKNDKESLSGAHEESIFRQIEQQINTIIMIIIKLTKAPMTLWNCYFYAAPYTRTVSTHTLYMYSIYRFMNQLRVHCTDYWVLFAIIVYTIFFFFNTSKCISFHFFVFHMHRSIGLIHFSILPFSFPLPRRFCSFSLCFFFSPFDFFLFYRWIYRYFNLSLVIFFPCIRRRRCIQQIFER